MKEETHKRGFKHANLTKSSVGQTRRDTERQLDRKRETQKYEGLKRQRDT